MVRRTETQLISTVLLITWLGTGDGGEQVSISAAEPSSMLVFIDPFDTTEKGDSRYIVEMQYWPLAIPLPAMLVTRFKSRNQLMTRCVILNDGLEITSTHSSFPSA